MDSRCTAAGEEETEFVSVALRAYGCKLVWEMNASQDAGMWTGAFDASPLTAMTAAIASRCIRDAIAPSPPVRGPSLVVPCCILATWSLDGVACFLVLERQIHLVLLVPEIVETAIVAEQTFRIAPVGSELLPVPRQ